MSKSSKVSNGSVSKGSGSSTSGDSHSENSPKGMLKDEVLKKEISSGAELSNSKIVSAKGTEDGLVLRIDGRAGWQEIVRDVEAFLSPKKSFFEKGSVSIEWLDRLPTSEQSSSLEELLKDKYKISIAAKKKPSLATVKGSAKSAISIASSNYSSKGSREVTSLQAVSGGSISGRLDSSSSENKDFKEQNNQGLRKVGSSSLYDAQDTQNSALVGDSLLEFAGLAGDDSQEGYMERMEKILSEDVLYEDDANAKTIFGTIRSGQRIETPFSLIVVGDVNPGADLVAGGDIIVVGSLRGTAHAAAYEEEATGRIIIAFQMRPIQLRIGSVISRGNSDLVEGAEVARIEDRRIVVEPFNSRMNLNRRLA